MISEIRATIQRFKGTQIRHICREADGSADKIVHLRHFLSVDDITHHNEFLAHVRSDVIGCGFSCG